MSITNAPQSSLPGSDSIKEIILWKKRIQSLIILSVSTIAWVLLELYQINFLTVLSWLAILVVASLFIWGNLLRLLGKDPLDLSRSEMREQSAIKLAMTVRAWIEEGIKLMYKVGAESDVFSFGLTVGGLWLLSQVGYCFDLLSLLYIGVVMGMTGPAIYVRYEDNIRRVGEKAKSHMRRYYEMFDDKVIKKVKAKVATTTSTISAGEKAKKVE